MLMLEWRDIEERLLRAQAAFLAADAQLLTVDANERTLTAKFATYVQDQFPGWNVDCDYNRLGARTKRLRWRDPLRTGLPEAVYPDIIVHRRNTNDNLLVIEAKKSVDEAVDDRKKLSAFKADERYKYAHAPILIFSAPPTPGIEFQRC